MSREFHTRRRSAVYVMAMGTALLVTLIGVSALLAVRVRHRVVEDTGDVSAARLHARSAIEYGLQMIEADPSWRDTLASGPWIASRSLGLGSLMLEGVDPVDDDLSTRLCDPLVLTGSGYQGTAHQVFRVILEPDAAGFDPLPKEVTDRGAIAYWRLGETSGTEVKDELGEYPGTYRNGVKLDQPVSFRCNPAAGFDGSNDLIEIPHDRDFELDRGAVQLWFYAETVTSWQGLFGKDAIGYGDGGHLSIWLNPSRQIEVRLQSRFNSYYVHSGSISSNRWYHVVFCWGSSGMYLYVNGGFVDYYPYGGGLGDTSGGSGNEEPIAIGVNTSNTDEKKLTGWDYPFRGMIDEVAIHNRYLWDDSVAALYDAGSQTPPHTMRIVNGSWRQVVN